MRKPIKFGIKDPDEKVFIRAKFAPYLKPSEIIVSQLWEILVKTGTDASAASMLSGTPIAIDNECSQLLINGVSGNDYVISCLATTSTGQILKLSYLVEVKDQELL